MNILQTFFFCLSLVASHLLAAPSCMEEVKLTFDGREWVKGFEQSAGGGSIVEYTLNDETVDNWSELVTVQKIPIAIPIKQFYDLFTAQLKESALPEIAHTKIISQTDNSLFFEWWIETGPQAQHEWLRLLQGPESVFLVHYVTKKLDQVDNVRSTWEKLLQEASLQSDCK